MAWLGLSAFADDLKLWYSRPANNWTEALPIGNSRLGAMVYGGTEREELQLNEETFWAGSPYANNNPNARYVLPVIRQLIFEGKNREAQNLVDANFFSGRHGMCYLPMGSLFLDFEGHDRATDFYRDLDLSDATATTRYKIDGVDYIRTVFASFADSVIMYEVLSELRDIAARGGISCTCGHRGCAMEVHGAAVDLVCPACGGRLRVSAATDEDLDRLCCQYTLTIKGRKGPQI